MCRVQNARLDESQVAIQIAMRNINNLRYAGDTTLMAENEGQQKSLLMKVKEKSEKTGLKVSIKKTKIMASNLIISWQIEEEKVKQLQTIFLSLKSLQTVIATMKLGVKKKKKKLPP